MVDKAETRSMVNTMVVMMLIGEVKTDILMVKDLKKCSKEEKRKKKKKWKWKWNGEIW
jgi:hypothetical protein